MKVYDVCVYDSLMKGFEFCDRHFTNEEDAHNYAKQMIQERVTVTADVLVDENNENNWKTIIRYGRQNPMHRKSRNY